MKSFREYLAERSYAVVARAGERSWQSQAAGDANSTARTPAPDKSHSEKMFRYHAKMAAVAKVKGDEKSHVYHNAKLKQFSNT